MPHAAEQIIITSRDGLAISALLIPGTADAPGVVVLHGAGSCKENHLDFAERVADAGMWALVPDLRGHGDTGGAMDAGMPGDALACLDELRVRGAGALALRGSSMGGFLALNAAVAHPGVRAVVAICPAQADSLARLFGQDWPRALPLHDAVWRTDGVARGFWHARGDETVPWSETLRLYSRAQQPKHLRVKMRGDHRSLQHDPNVQADTIQFLLEHLHA
jgi:dienelactone hydrolase